MTTINKEDFLQVLRDNPELREAVRAQNLGEDLLELPANFYAFVATQTEFITAQVEFNKTTGQRLDRLEGGQTRLEGKVDRLTDDVGLIKGVYAGNLAAMEAADIAENMGYEFTRVLSREELRFMSTLVRDNYSANRLRSFRHADLVIVANSNTETNYIATYIAIEVSFTADTRDTGRAINNAEILAQATGLPTRAVVAGIRYTKEVQDLIDQEQVYWHDLQKVDLQPE